MVLLLVLHAVLSRGFTPLSVSACFLVAFCASHWAKGDEVLGTINVALHAQSRFDQHGWVAGSEVTTAGLLRALKLHPRVERCQVFAPFAYEGLEQQHGGQVVEEREAGEEQVRWDLVIIEGFTGSVPNFIHKVRSLNPDVIVFHFCLDTYPSLDKVLGLDVDGFLTNSALLQQQLNERIPTAVVHLAADPESMRPVTQPDNKYDTNVVYVGQMKESKHRLVDVLLEVAPLGLSIYGLGWDRFPSAAPLLPHWRGILPLEDLAAVYSSSKVVIGTTEEAQRGLGMVNNRVFEVMACEAAIVSDHFAALEELFGHTISYFKQPGDAYRHAQSLIEDDALRRRVGAEGRAFVSAKHTYVHRLDTILRHFDQVKDARDSSDSPNDAARAVRVNAPKVVVVWPRGSTAEAATAAIVSPTAAIVSPTLAVGEASLLSRLPRAVAELVRDLEETRQYRVEVVLWAGSGFASEPSPSVTEAEQDVEVEVEVEVQALCERALDPLGRGLVLGPAAVMDLVHSSSSSPDTNSRKGSSSTCDAVAKGLLFAAQVVSDPLLSPAASSFPVAPLLLATTEGSHMGSHMGSQSSGRKLKALLVPEAALSSFLMSFEALVMLGEGLQGEPATCAAPTLGVETSTLGVEVEGDAPLTCHPNTLLRGGSGSRMGSSSSGNSSGSSEDERTQRQSKLSALSASMDAALFGLRSSTAVTIVYPQADETVQVTITHTDIITEEYREGGGQEGQEEGEGEGREETLLSVAVSVSVEVGVSFKHFSSPADGMWCVHAGGVLLHCVGDETDKTEVQVPLQVEVPSSRLPKAGVGQGQPLVIQQRVLARFPLELSVSLHAGLSPSLEQEGEARRSQPVNVWVELLGGGEKEA